MSDTIHYYFNDPTTPDLVLDVLPPPSSHLPFNVVGYQGGGHPKGTVEDQAAGCYITLVNSINYIAQRSGGLPNKWAAVKTLTVIPRAGTKLNAYYDRYSLRFFHASDQFNVKKIVYTCESADVVSHEVGHAILDAIRPDIWRTPYLEVFAFHEGFADCNTLLHICLHNNVVEKAFQETNYDLRKSNVISRVGEELGHALTGTFMGLRDLSTKFRYVSPDTLPKDGPIDVLTKEPHSFSRVWGSTFYDILISIYEIKAANMDKMAALHAAADICANYLIKASKIAPVTPKFTEAIAKAFLAVDASEGGLFKDLLTRIFINNGLMQQFSAMDYEGATIQSDDKILESSSIVVTKRKSMSVEKLSDILLLSQSDNPLLFLEIELPAEDFYQFNAGIVEEAIVTTRQETIDAAYDCLDYLNEKALVGPTDDTPFEAIDGKLVRNNISCDCYYNNSIVKGAPEYGKPWKPENNSGCCAGGCNGKTPEPVVIPKLGCYITNKICNNRKIRSCATTRIKTC